MIVIVALDHRTLKVYIIESKIIIWNVRQHYWFNSTQANAGIYQISVHKKRLETFYVFSSRKINIQCPIIRATQCGIDIIYVTCCTFCHLPCDTDTIWLAFVAFVLYTWDRYSCVVFGWKLSGQLQLYVATLITVKLRLSNIIGQAAVNLIRQSITNAIVNTYYNNKRGISLVCFILSISHHAPQTPSFFKICYVICKCFHCKRLCFNNKRSFECVFGVIRN